MAKHDGEDALYDELLNTFHDEMDAVDLDEMELAVSDHDLQAVERAAKPEESRKALVAVLAAFLFAAFVASGKKAAAQARIDFNALETRYIEWLQQRVAGTVVTLTAHELDVLRNTFIRGLRANLSAREIARQLRFNMFLTDRFAGAIANAQNAMFYTNVPRALMAARLTALFNGYLQERARVLAATEITAAKAAAVLLVQREVERQDPFASGSRKRWVTALDEMVCPVCQPLHNVTVDLNGTFPGGFDSPPAHPICRCHVEIVARSQ